MITVHIIPVLTILNKHALEGVALAARDLNANNVYFLAFCKVGFRLKLASGTLLYSIGAQK